MLYQRQQVIYLICLFSHRNLYVYNYINLLPCRELPCLVYWREGIRLQRIELPQDYYRVHVPRW